MEYKIIIQNTKKVLQPRHLMMIAMALIAAVFVFIPLSDFYQNQYHWHFRQAPFRQGGLELLIAGLGIFLCGFLGDGKWKYLILIVVTEAYLRRHNVDFILCATILFADSLVGIGYFVFTRISMYKIPTFFISGASIYVLVAMILSLLFKATQPLLLGLLTIFLVLFYAKAFKESLLSKLLSAVHNIYTCGHLTRFNSVLLFAGLLMLVAKAGYGINYDEAWYSLRVNEVLNVNGSFFENLNLLGNWVHQYPKFFEILLFPLQYFNSFFISKMLSVISFGILLIAAHEFWDNYKLTINQKLLMSVVLISIPVVTVDATSAKADLFCGFVFLLGVFYFFKAISEKSFTFLTAAIALTILSLAVKLSVIPYLVFFITLCIVTGFSIRKQRPLWNGLYISMAFLFLIVFCVVTWRTFAITGVPFVGLAETSPLVSSLYDLLGLKYNYPYGPVITQYSKTDSLPLLVDFLLKPTGVRQSITWVSNIVVPLMLLAIFWFIKFKRGAWESLLVISSGVMIFFFIGFVFNNIKNMGGDGNYYLVPLLIMVTIGASAFKYLPNYSLFLVLIFSVYIVGNMPIAFVSAQSWHSGTRGFDEVFNQLPLNKTEIENGILRRNGLKDVHKYMKSLDSRSCVALGGGPVALYHVGCRIETANSILSGRPYLISNADKFIDLLEEKKVSHLVVQNYFPDNPLGRFCRLLVDHGIGKVSRFDNYVIVDIEGVSRDMMRCFAEDALFPKKVSKLNKTLQYIVSSLGHDDKKYSGWRVDLNPVRSGILRYYENGDDVIFIKPDTSIEFQFDSNGQRMNEFQAHFAKHIAPPWRKAVAGEFALTIFSGNQILAKDNFEINPQGYADCKIKLNKKSGAIRVRIEYLAGKRQVNPKVPAVIINPRIHYCE